jgi:hypothetical protein
VPLTFLLCVHDYFYTIAGSDRAMWNLDVRLSRFLTK